MDIRYVAFFISCCLILSSFIIIINSDDIIQEGNSGIRSLGYPEEPELAFASETSMATLSNQNQPLNSFNDFSRGSRGELEVEPNNDVDNAHLVTFTFTKTINGSLSSSDTVDWFKFQVTKGDVSGNGATHFAIILSDKNTGSGVKMILFGDNENPPYLHRLAVSVVHDASGTNPPGIFDMIAPHDGYLYLQVVPNGVADGNYTLDFNKVSENNSAFDNDNSFASPNWVDAIIGTYMPNVYLDPKWDVHDFYNFTGYENQSLVIKLTNPSTADYDIYLFDKQTTTYIASGTLFGFGVNEKIDIKLTKNGNYYVRVVAKIDGSINHNNNLGLYAIDIRGNVPPIWRNDSTESYTLDEDDPPIYIEGENIWMDLNKKDQVSYILWNESRDGGAGDWEPRVDNNIPVVSRVWYPGQDFKVEIINNNTITVPDEAIKITPLKDQFGIKEFKLGAKDNANPYGLGVHNITINIMPVNDPPVINNTKRWKRFLPDMLDVRNNKIFINEENDFKIQVTAFDVDHDNLNFTDNSELFDIDPVTGIISFYANYKLIDTHKVNITVTDDGSNPNELSTTLTFILEIRDSGIDHRPKTNLFSPENNSITKSLFPTLIWNGTDIDSEQSELSYTIYLSNIEEKVLSLANDAKIIEGINRTSYTFSDPPLSDQTWYYWTVIPNDGIFTGISNDGLYKFKIDTSVISPEVALVSPGNKSILNYTDVLLKWNKIYDGTEVVTYDIYLGVSATELELQKQDYKETSYILYDLASEHTYYWKVVPKAGIPPNRITGEESPIFIFSIRKTYKPPTVELISPDDRSIFKTNEISLSWKVSYKNPTKVDYELYISTSEIFSTTPETKLSETFYRFTAPEDITYYWKVIPFAGDVPGPESEVRWFKIDPNIVQPIVIPKYPENDKTLNVTYLELQWSLEYSGAKSKVKYDVYLDNTTSYRPGMRQINNNYKQFFIPVTLDDNKTYYWYVLPSIETDEGFIVGEFQNNISSFKVDTNYHPPPEPGFELILEPNYLQLPLGNQSIINIILTNTGNIDLTLDITYLAEPNDLLFVNLKTRRINIPQGQLEIVDLDVSAPPGTEPNTGVTITVQAVADGVSGLAERKVLTVQVEAEEEPISPNGNGADSYLMYIIGIIVVLVIIMIIFSLFITKRRQKVKEEGEVETTEQRISVPSSSPYKSPPAVSVGYKPQQAVSTPPIARATTTGIGLSLPASAAGQAVKIKPIKPVTPVRPVTPVKPVAPVASATKRSAAIAAKPVKPVRPLAPVKPITAKPVRPVTGPNAAIARPVTPVKPIRPVKPVKPV